MCYRGPITQGTYYCTQHNARAARKYASPQMLQCKTKMNKWVRWSCLPSLVHEQNQCGLDRSPFCNIHINHIRVGEGACCGDQVSRLIWEQMGGRYVCSSGCNRALGSGFGSCRVGKGGVVRWFMGSPDRVLVVVVMEISDNL